MSKKVTIEGFIFHVKYSWEKTGEFTFVGCEMKNQSAYTKVMPHSFTVEIPDDFNPIHGQVAAIKKQQLELKAAFAKKMMELEDDLSKLLCIESAVACMSAQNNGGPAFPAPDAGEEHFSQRSAYMGMTLRDYFAAKAMQGCMAYFNESRGDFHTNAQPDEVAKYCYEVADAMLFARDQS